MPEVRLTDGAATELDGLPLVAKTQVAHKLDVLADWPNVSGLKRLSGEWAGYWRVRTGDYRIVFEPTAERVLVVRIGHRRDVYDA